MFSICAGRADPKCSLGHVLKALFKNDNFMNKVGNACKRKVIDKILKFLYELTVRYGQSW